jgi:glutamate/tyrosine decarboxylase-like PLP-dependent enzyme
MTIRRVLLAADYRIDMTALDEAITPQVVGLVGSAPCLPFGTIDPLAEMGQLAEAHDLWLHVDACLGGYFAPFVERSAGEVPAYDFRIPGVRSLSADLHKYGYAPKGNALIAYRHAEDAVRIRFAFADWPKGLYETQTLSGTRSGGGVAATWAVMRYLGASGYCDRVARVMRTRARL